MERTNTEVRQIILSQHDRLRAQMNDLQSWLDRWNSTGPVPEAMATGFQAFIQEFLRHVAHEEQLLTSALADVDAWARGRLETMHAEHVEQRARLAELTGSRAPTDGPTFSQAVRDVIAWIRADMAAEEKDLLSPTLLRDDIIVVDAFGG